MPGQENKPKKPTPQEKLMAEVRKSIAAAKSTTSRRLREEEQSFNPMFGATRTEETGATTTPQAEPQNALTSALLGFEEGAGEEEEIQGTNPLFMTESANREPVAHNKGKNGSTFVQKAAAKFNNRYDPKRKGRKLPIEAVFSEKHSSPDGPLTAFVNPMGKAPGTRTTPGGANPPSSRPAAGQAQQARPERSARKKIF